MSDQPTTYPYPYPCPKCGAPMVKRRNTQTNAEFFGCSNFPGCKTSRDLDWTPEKEEAPC